MIINKQLVILLLMLAVAGLMLSCGSSTKNDTVDTPHAADDLPSDTLQTTDPKQTDISQTDSVPSDSMTQYNDKPAASHHPTKHALVIGLGKYQDTSWSEIHGDRDVQLIRQMLVDCGYTDILTLTNAEASKSGIGMMLSKLISVCAPGDIVYIHFSGHGQQITDLDGDEDDGFDEAWIPYDAQYRYSDAYKGENHLLDDEIQVWLTKIMGVIGDHGHLLVVADTCHSGDCTRNGVGDDIYSRGADDDFVIPLDKHPRHRPKPDVKWLTLSACLDYEVNCEIKTQTGDFYGMLSYALFTMHHDFSALTNNECMEKIALFVDRNRGVLPQEPTLTGVETGMQLATSFR